MGIPIVGSYQKMTRKQRIFIQLAFAKLGEEIEKKIPKEGKPKGKYDKAREIVERKRR